MGIMQHCDCQSACTARYAAQTLRSNGIFTTNCVYTVTLGKYQPQVAVVASTQSLYYHSSLPCVCMHTADKSRCQYHNDLLIEVLTFRASFLIFKNF
jgi:hypothetical protein